MRFLLFSLLLSLSCAFMKLEMHRHERPSHRRGIDRWFQKGWDDPLTGGASQAAYYVDLEVGTPKQAIRMDPDTGSSNFVVVTPSCGCAHYGSAYDPAISNTAVVSTCGACANTTSPQYLDSCQLCTSGAGPCPNCNAAVAYGDGSQATGLVFRDVMHVGEKSYPMFIGAMDDVSGKFSSDNDDGILGLAFDPLDGGIPTFFDQLVGQGVPNEFTMCFGRYDGGSLVLGGTDQSQINASGTLDVTIPVDNSIGFYGVTIAGYSMGDDTYEVPEYLNSGILDSGTTLLVTSDADFVSSFHTWLSKHSSSHYIDHLINNPSQFQCLDADQLAEFMPCMPPLEVTFMDTTGATKMVPIPASSYLWLYKGSANPCGSRYAVTFGIQYSPGLSSPSTILGDTFLRNVHTTWDREKLTARFQTPNFHECGTGIPGVTDTTTCSGSSGGFLHLPYWQIGVIVGGVVVAIVLIIIIAVCCCRKRKQGHSTEGYAPVQTQKALAPYPDGSV